MFNFSGQKINWSQTNHGMYLIRSGGWCWSDSQKMFNNVKQSFEFGNGDVIFMEYDPIDRILRYRKNKNDETFEMPIKLSPQNDEYYACVCLDYCISTWVKKPPLIELIDSSHSDCQHY